MICRQGCGACCIAPSITSAIPGMQKGKAAGVRCVQLDERNLCKLFGKPERPNVCLAFKPDQTICGTSNEFALDTLLSIEILTQ